MILQLRHATFITQSLKEIHSGRETGLIDTGPFNRREKQTAFVAIGVKRAKNIYKIVYKYCIRFCCKHVIKMTFYLV